MKLHRRKYRQCATDDNQKHFTVYRSNSWLESEAAETFSKQVLQIVRLMHVISYSNLQYSSLIVHQISIDTHQGFRDINQSILVIDV